MDYERDIEEVWQILRYKHGNRKARTDAIQWLRAHDARVLRDMKHPLLAESDSWNSELERRAQEIERGE